MTLEECDALVAMLVGTFTAADVSSVTATGYHLALAHVDADDVAVVLPGILAGHQYGQRLPLPREILDALPRPTAAHQTYSRLRNRWQDGAELTAAEVDALNRAAVRIGAMPAASRPLPRRIGSGS